MNSSLTQFFTVNNPYSYHPYMFITENYSSKFKIVSFWAPALKSSHENDFLKKSLDTSLYGESLFFCFNQNFTSTHHKFLKRKCKYYLKIFSNTISINLLQPCVAFLYLWKHQKTLRFSDVFKGYRKATLGCNGLKIFKNIVKCFSRKQNIHNKLD